MMVDVHLCDGRTTFRFMSRGKAVHLFKRDPAELGEEDSVRVWVRWHPQSDWEPTRLQYVRRHSVSFVVQVDPAERAAFFVAQGVTRDEC